MPGIAVHTDTEPPLEPRHRPDADRAEILAELDNPATPRVAANGSPRERPMSGLRVLDLTQILAGPTSGRILGELGAEVVKINAPERRVAVHGVVNRGKQSILLDVQNPAGREVFWKLAETADVIVQNFPTGTAERYGIGYEDVKARRPDIVYVSVSCYGSRGPLASDRGYETQGQAVTGIMARAGGDGKPAVLGPYNLLDYGTGVLAAFAAALGLYRRAATGDGGHLTTSLAQTGTLHQARFLLEYAGKEWNEPAGPGALGEGELQRFHRAADGWFFLGLAENETEVLTRVMNGSRFADADVATWVDRLREAGLGAHAVVGIEDLMVDELACARELSITQISEEAGEVRMPGIVIGMSATPPRHGAPAGKPGAAVRTVLDRVGLAGALGELERSRALQTTNVPTAWGGP
jgi:crotonobetainyl-CoA:carnitine CoA-transferase CaiB-like acyl-CoA transferase